MSWTAISHYSFLFCPCNVKIHIVKKTMVWFIFIWEITIWQISTHMFFGNAAGEIGGGKIDFTNWNVFIISMLISLDDNKFLHSLLNSWKKIRNYLDHIMLTSRSVKTADGMSSVISLMSFDYRKQTINGWINCWEYASKVTISVIPFMS